jgi:hypothetical protein
MRASASCTLAWPCASAAGGGRRALRRKQRRGRAALRDDRQLQLLQQRLAVGGCGDGGELRADLGRRARSCAANAALAVASACAALLCAACAWATAVTAACRAAVQSL